MKRFLLLAAVVAGFTSQASAAFLSNGSFETHSAAGTIGPSGILSLPTSGAGSTAITDWKVVDGGIDYVSTYWQPADGAHSLDLNGGSPGAIQQTIGTAAGTTSLNIGEQYAITFSMAGNPEGADFGTPSNPSTKEVRVSVGALTQDFTFDITVFNPTRSKTSMGWITQTFLFVATSTNPLLKFASINSPGSRGPTIDNVQITPVPLPASLALLLAGLPGFAGLGWVLRRKGDSQPQA